MSNRTLKQEILRYLRPREKSIENKVIEIIVNALYAGVMDEAFFEKNFELIIAGVHGNISVNTLSKKARRIGKSVLRGY